jgi:putative membrane protein insertion efficiency factor
MTANLCCLLRLAAVVLLVLPVRFYQACLRPVLPTVCRFYPSCSDYFILAVQKYGPLRGACKGVGRICRCHPWSPGGYDPP